jgi:hypothetical protein
MVCLLLLLLLVVSSISLAEFRQAFNIPDENELAARLLDMRQSSMADAEQAALGGMWRCNNCTFINSIHNNTCVVCELGWTGRREVPPDKWMCSGEYGGCTFFNAKTQFYCEICSRARPDLATVRF